MSRLFSRATVTGASLSGANLKALLTALWDALNAGGFSDAVRSTLTTTSSLTTAQCGQLLIDATAGNIVLTLPASGTATDDAFYNLRRIDSSAFSVTVQPAGTDTVEGGASITLPANSATEIQIPGGSANWRVYGIGGPTPAASRAAIGAIALADGAIPGTIVTWGGASVPTGYLSIPVAASTISRTTYAALFAAIGTTWGVGDGSTTFGLPFIPAGYAFLQSNGSPGTQTIGLVQDHSHPITTPLAAASVGGTVAGHPGNTGAIQAVINANLAAGTYVRYYIKF
jgi:microcystin-dependent protein